MFVTGKEARHDRAAESGDHKWLSVAKPVPDENEPTPCPAPLKRRMGAG